MTLIRAVVFLQVVLYTRESRHIQGYNPAQVMAHLCLLLNLQNLCGRKHCSVYLRFGDQNILPNLNHLSSEAQKNCPIRKLIYKSNLQLSDPCCTNGTALWVAMSVHRSGHA